MNLIHRLTPGLSPEDPHSYGASDPQGPHVTVKGMNHTRVIPEGL